MRFTCKRARLAEIAALVGQAVSTKTTKRIFECLHLSARKGGALRVSGTDLEVAMRYRIDEAEIREEGEAVAPAALFSGVLREIADETVEISVARRKMTIDTDGGKFEIQCEEVEDYPQIPAFPERPDGSVTAEDLRALVRKTAFAAGKEAARYTLNGIRILAGRDSVRFVATDGRRLATLARPLTESANRDRDVRAAIVPVRALQHVDRVAAESGGAIAFSLEEKFVAFRSGSAEVSSRVLDGVFPNYEEILPKECKLEASIPVGAFLSRLRQVEQFAAVESKAVAIQAAAGEMTISAAGGEGSAEVKLGIDYDGEPIRVGFNPAFLLDALKIIDGEKVTLGMNNANAAAQLSDGSGLLYVIMPVLID